MFKIIGAIIVIGAAGFIGMGKYSRLYERKRALCIICDGAEKIRNNLKCMCMPLYEAFLSGGDFFEKAAKEISGGKSPAEAVTDTVRKISVLSKEDIDAAERFAEGLSAQNCEGQLRNIELFIKEVNHRIEKAEGELQTKGKLTVKGSILAATALVLVLL